MMQLTAGCVSGNWQAAAFRAHRAPARQRLQALDSGGRQQEAAMGTSITGEGLGTASFTVWEILDRIGRLPYGRRRERLAGRFLDLLVP